MMGVTIAGIALACVLVLMARFAIRRDLLGRRRAREALQEARDQLETCVQQRTAELARAKEAALSSKSRLAGIIDSAMDAILTVDEQQRIVLFNPAAEKMFGCPAPDAMGQSLDQFIPERFRSAHAHHQRAFGETGITQREMGKLGSICGLRSSGEEFPIEAAVSRVEVGGQQLFTAILRDITERVAAEEALRRQASLIDQIHDAVLIWEWDGRIIVWNREAERLYGHLRDQAVGNVAHDLLRTETADTVEGFRRILEQTNAWEGELQHVTRDGRKIIVESRMSRLLDKGQAYVIETNRDITDRKRVYEKLVEAHRRTTAILESISDGFNTFDREWRYTYVNAAAAKMVGKTREELLGKNLWELWPHAADSPFGVAYRRAVRENVPLQVEAFYPEPLNAWFEARCYPSPEGLSLFFNDTTQRKRADEEIRLLNEDLERRVAQRTADLEVAAKELESFSYSVAHDLRAPLRAVDGFSDAVLEDYGSQLPEQARNYLRTIRRGAQRMGALIDDLLAFSRLGRQPLTKQPVDMEALVRSVLQELLPRGQERQVELVNGNLPAADGDPALLRQVWTNLLSNAIKYTSHTNQPRIEIGARAEASQGNVYFVRDNGAGFDMKYADKLFGVFQRLHRADEFEGTGIGLAIVQRVVHRHGGRVWAEAQLNEGATFYFTLEGGT